MKQTAPLPTDQVTNQVTNQVTHQVTNQPSHQTSDPLSDQPSILSGWLVDHLLTGSGWLVGG